MLAPGQGNEESASTTFIWSIDQTVAKAIYITSDTHFIPIIKSIF